LLLNKPLYARKNYSSILKRSAFNLKFSEKGKKTPITFCFMTTLLPDQTHIDWNAPEIQETIKMMETSYPGGLVGYVNKAKTLLSKNNTNTNNNTQHEDQQPTRKRNLKNPAHQVNIDVSDVFNLKLLVEGNKIAGQQTVFVLVAGGLGERLGAKSLKLALPVFTCDQDTFEHSSSSTSKNYSKNNFLSFYLSWMIHLRQQQQSNPADENTLVRTPVIIMTSDDTHSRTQVLLEEFFQNTSKYCYSNNIDAKKFLDIHLLKQNGVPCVKDNNGTLATTEDGKAFLMKPHGHGDIHRLILSSGLLPNLLKSGFTHIAFLQDTNAGAPTTIPFSLAVMQNKNWTMSFTCVPRLPGEAIGALVDADREDDEKERVTFCVEYNVLDDLLKNEGMQNGDCATVPPENPTYSPFPGTINTLLLKLDAYSSTLTRTDGVIAEFINPKYADPKVKTVFKSPARLETLMQDICLELKSENDPIIIGACVFDRRTYFPVKNALMDGITKWKSQGIDPHNGSQGEAGIHLLRRLLWQNFVSKQSVESWPLRFCVPPPALQESFAASPHCDVIVEKTLPLSLFPIFLSEDNDKEGLAGIAKHFVSSSASENVKISRKSALVVKGNVVIKSLNLDGALVIDAGVSSQSSSSILVDLPVDFVLENAGWNVVCIDSTSAQQIVVDEPHQLRGFKFVEKETAMFKIKDGESGSFVLKLDEESKKPVLVPTTPINSVIRASL
jgi:UDP-sugar pyrophosphorylase